MEDQKINTDINLVKEEMIAIWAYLDTYDKLFESTDKNQIKILENTAPGFFALVQTALIESSFGRLVRLMDPSHGNENLCFRSMFCPCYQDNILKLANEKFSEVCFEWNSGKYRILKTHRNKVHAHNDFVKISNAQRLVTTKLTSESVQLLKELFHDLWEILKISYFTLKETSLLEPKYQKLNQLPNALLRHLKFALQMEKILKNHPELYRELDMNNM